VRHRRPVRRAAPLAAALALLAAGRASADPRPGDPLELLWGHRLDFTHGTPRITIRIADGLDEVGFSPRGPARLEGGGGGHPVEVQAGERLRARLREAQPAALSWAPLLARLGVRDRAALERARTSWGLRGVPTRLRTAGGIYGIAGKVVDNRRNLLVADGAFTEESAGAFAADALARWGEKLEVHAEVVGRPQGTVEIVGPGGEVRARGDRWVSLDVAGGQGFTVDDRPYRGRLLLTVDARGRLAVVAALPLEELLQGLVPSEMPAGAPAEALKAQAVTARSNVLAQIGTRHLSDPWSLCNEVHCQAYRGEGAHAPSTDAAVRATAGEAIFRRGDRALVDGVYSAMCGGHGEDDDAVWGGSPNPSLRGHLDMPPEDAAPWEGGLADEGRLASFLSSAPASWCSRAPGARPDRYRWERRLTPAELDGLVSSLGVGTVRELTVTSRGVSGRAVTLRVSGAKGDAAVRGELRIRRLLGNLPSAMFLVSRDGDAWILRGGGWGHGAGMCQWGAIGRAAAGQDYRRILGAYFSGAEVARIY
jgi:stage II sporulation protein D